MLNITNITPPRVPLTDARTGLISREWYRFFLNLFDLTGSGTSDFSLTDLQIGPATSPETFEEINRIYNAALLNSPPVQLGTLSSVNQDNVSYIGYSTAPSPDPATFTSIPVGTTWWDGGTTLNMQMTPNVTQKVGESQYFYVQASGAVTKGQLVMFTGVVGASGVITVAPATGVTDGQYLVGVAAENLALNAFGMVQSFGILGGLNTNAFNEGDILYYDPSAPGGLTNTLPTAPNVKATVAAVIKKSGGNGEILIRISSGSILGGTDSNVQFGTLANNNLISYDSALGYWKNVTPGSVPFGITAGQVVYGSATGSLTSSANFAVSGTTMTLANAIVQTALKVSSLTATRVPFVTTAGQITDSSNLTFDTVTNTLTAANATVQGNLTVDTDTLVVDPVNNYVGIGRSTPAIKLDIYDAGAASVRVASDTIAQGFIVLSYVNGTGAGTNSMYKSRGTFASPTGVSSGDQSGLFRFYALDATGGTDREVARMTAFVGTASGANDISGRIVFWTRPTGAGGTLTQRVSVEADGQLNALYAMRVDGNVGFYGTTPAAQPTAVGNVAVTTAGATNTVFRNTTFTGGTGTTAYTIGDIVRALKLLGLITS